MKKIALALVALFSTVGAFAQKESITINDFTYTESVGETYAIAARNKVIEGLSNMARLEITEANADAGLASKYILDGHVISITTTRQASENGGYNYDAKVAYQLKVTDRNSQKLVANKTFEASSSSLLSIHKTEVDAANAAIDNISTQLKNFVDEVFKLKGSIVEISEVKKDEAKTLYISIGSDNGILKGQKLDVFVEKEVAGRTVSKLIGEVKVEAVEAGDLSLCKVTKGGKEINAAVNEGRNTSVVSKVNNNIFNKVNSNILGF